MLVLAIVGDPQSRVLYVFRGGARAQRTLLSAAAAVAAIAAVLPQPHAEVEHQHGPRQARAAFHSTGAATVCLLCAGALGANPGGAEWNGYTLQA